MKGELYAWVPWFQELANKIAEGSPEQLAKRARQVKWRDSDDTHPLLKYGPDNIDPFSFIYTLTANCGKVASRTRVVGSVSTVFELQAKLPVDLDYAFYFPRANPQNTLFHQDGVGNPKLLWELFRDAVQGIDSVRAEVFSDALQIKNVRITKLTQTLFLIDGKVFMPYDKSTRPLLGDKVPKTPDWQHYRQAIDAMRAAFPGCELYEINLFAYLTHKGIINKVGTKIFQVSTNVFDDGVDHWEDFDRNSWVYTNEVAPEVESEQDGTPPPRTYPVNAPNTGDVVLAHNGDAGKGIGIIWPNDYRHSRLHVVWLNKMQTSLGARFTPQRGFTQAHKIEQAFRRCEAYQPTFAKIDGLQAIHEAELTEEGKAEVRSDLGISQPLNQILYGPPGTGKTWHTVNLALAIVNGRPNGDHNLEQFEALRFDPAAGKGTGKGNIAMVTFHQNFAYEDFVEGIRPILKDDAEGGLRYCLHQGLFKQIATAARERPSERFVLIIDEINRGNIARIFGELITLIEDSRRVGGPEETRVMLPYSNEQFGVPKNLYLIGTMNTADRSIQLLDTALRRRFAFVEMMPDPDHDSMARIENLSCAQMLRTINNRIALLLDREHQIGHTYLLDVNDIETLAHRFKSQIFPLLQEYFFDDWSKIKAVLGASPFVEVDSAAEKKLLDPELTDDGRKIFTRLSDNDPQWKSSESYRKIYQTEPGPPEES